jgi:hypothetical protein
MESNLFKINFKDLSQSAVNAVIAAVVVGFYGIVTTDGFNLFTANWAGILQSVINWAFAGFIGSVGKRFLQDSEGTVHLGVMTIRK